MSTAPEHTEHTEHITTYLVGTRAAYTRYLAEHGVPETDPHVRRVSTLEHIEGAHSGDVIFLRGFETLRDWRAIYNFVIGTRAGRRMRNGEQP